MAKKIHVKTFDDLRDVYEANTDNLCSDLYIKITNAEFLNFTKKYIAAFSNCTFELCGDISFKDINSDYHLEFYKCTFKTKVIWRDIENSTQEVDTGIIFQECVFENGIEFTGIQKRYIHSDFELSDNEKYSFKLVFNSCEFHNRIIKLYHLDKAVIKFKNNNAAETCIQFFSFSTVNLYMFVGNKFKLLDITIGDKLYLNIEECNAFSGINIRDVESIEELKIRHSKSIPITYKDTTNIECIHVSESTFEKNIVLDQIRLKEINFYKAIFIESLSWKSPYTIEATKATFKATECMFKNNVELENLNLTTACFDESTFEGKLYFINNCVEELSCVNCDFEKSAKIVNPEGIINANFDRCTIRDRFYFNAWKDNIIDLKKDSDIIFTHLYVLSTGYVIIRYINRNKDDKTKRYHGNFNFEYANILGTVAIQDSSFNKLNFDKATIVGQLNIDNVDIKKYSSRETLTKIKNEFIKKNDTVSALKYKSKEYNKHFKDIFAKAIGDLWKIPSIDIYDREIKYFFFLHDRILLIIVKYITNLVSNIFDITLLLLNKISNNNGQWWFQGVLFTLSIAFVFYTLYSYSIIYDISCDLNFNTSDWILLKDKYWESEHLQQVVKFLWIPDGLKKIEGDIYSYIWFVLGKILIGYGIYQTISAFRKYGK